MDWTDLRQELIEESQWMPAAVKPNAVQLIQHAVAIASQIAGNLELVYRRGVQTGHEESHADVIAMLACLKWATTFAQGAFEMDDSLHNPVFEAHLAACYAVITKTERN